MTERCLITGCEGFVGSHLADLLVSEGFDVYGTMYEKTKNIDHLRAKIRVFKCDMNDRRSVEAIVKAAKPDYLFHLAAQSFVDVSWGKPELTIRTNVIGTLNFLEAIRKLGTDPVIEIVGSSSIYGPDQGEIPISENSDFAPTSFYAVSKVGEEMLAHLYHKVYGMKNIKVRPFNMTGPRKTGDACADFTKGLVEIELGKQSALKVGDLNAVRDFTDGRDAVKALLMLAKKGTPGEIYNLCSGMGHRMRDILDKAISISGLENVKVIKVKRKLRPYDDPIYIGDNSKLRALGWRPRISIEKTLVDMLEHWRGVL